MVSAGAEVLPPVEAAVDVEPVDEAEPPQAARLTAIAPVKAREAARFSVFFMGFLLFIIKHFLSAARQCGLSIQILGLHQPLTEPTIMPLVKYFCTKG